MTRDVAQFGSVYALGACGFVFVFLNLTKHFHSFQIIIYNIREKLDASVLPRNMLATTPINKWQLITIPYTTMQLSVLQRNALGQKDGCALIIVAKECSWTKRRMCTHQCYKGMLLDKKTDVHLHVSTQICTHITNVLKLEMDICTAMCAHP